MTLDKLLAIVNEAYPDDCIAQEANKPGWSGDSLATFIVNELRSIHHPEASSLTQLQAARVAMNRARNELDEVCVALRRQIDRVEAELKENSM